MDDGHGSHVFSSIPGAPSPQFALLNYLFPGFSVFSSAANASLASTRGATDASTYLPFFLALVAALVFFWPQLSGQLWGIVEGYFISSVRIRPDDEIYNMVMLWISRQQFAQSSRHFLANTNINSRSHWVYRSLPDSDDSDDDMDTASESGYHDGVDGTRARKTLIHYTPSGRCWFWYRGRLLAFQRCENTDRLGLQSIAEREELYISCLGRSPQILKELLLEARRAYLERDERKTVIYRGNLGETYWQRCMSRLNRPLSTVVLDHGIKQDLLHDVSDYLRPATRRWYSNRGIPYRRGYLLYGPPGTGKSSLSLALAGYFRVKIYIVSLSSGMANEENIMSLFNDLPTRCIVLLEDIDTAGLTHTRDGAAAVIEPPPSPAPPAASPNLTGPDAAPSSATAGRLSLSGLLNVLDGVASQEGRILIMTTNHIDKLDKALIRPGRVDMMIPFGAADSSMVFSMFRAIYSPYENEVAPVDCPQSNEVANTASCAKAEEKPSNVANEDAQKRINELAQKFAEAIPESEFSPAEVQGLLLRHKHSPKAAIDAIDDWVAQMRKDKEEEAKQSDKDGEPKGQMGPNQRTLGPKV
ncbi:hypothetical protein CDD82_4266 [Ophiocordyceps australis]|uniref:AAA+ ATPase domain-containing protein n=1 Tax=Ophiocordyceps australis TaxID=1399860 RepID=A0A2C5ZT00_9HYPO|nr:hypothetical protein CDD82_4266 [Ophiocordyceps australis]